MIMFPGKGSSSDLRIITNEELIGNVTIRVTQAYQGSKKWGTKTGFYMNLQLGSQEQKTSITSQPSWNENLEFSVFQYKFACTATLCKGSSKKIGQGSVVLEAPALIDGQLISLNLLQKKKPIGQIKLYAKFTRLKNINTDLESLALTQPLFLSILFDAYDPTSASEPPDIIAMALYELFSHHDRLLDLMKYIIRYEADRVDEIALMLRDESPSVRILSKYVRLTGEEFLVKFIKIILPSIISEKGSVELDPSKIDPRDEITQNQTNMIEKANLLFTAIFSNFMYIHPNIRELCREIIRVITVRFPSQESIGLGGVIFLRYISPCIVAPDSVVPTYKDDLVPKVRRTLVLLTKILQALSNNVMFGEKEPFMVCMNDLLDQNRPKMQKFIEDILNCQSIPATSTVTDCELSPVPTTVFENLSNYLINHNDKIFDCIEKRLTKNQSDEKELSSLSKRLKTLIEGIKSSKAKLTSSTSSLSSSTSSLSASSPI
eukprot:TRINITY_DN1110_c3_g1_i1.p1 TRINITY_DN1110_c3_g1~~TRINITY_DN1110_c3_g1_i1.p1  ORF type:complete len:490 (+),score=165.12 TRINITY_DN1110_c3_g1_i1:3-1472(+)